MMSTIGIAIILLTLIAAQCQTETDRVTLKVNVVSLLDGARIKAGTVEVLSVDTTTNTSNHVIASEPIDDAGLVTFQLLPRRYLSRMAHGYTGQVEIDLQEPSELQLKVFQVPQGYDFIPREMIGFSL